MKEYHKTILQRLEKLEVNSLQIENDLREIIINQKKLLDLVQPITENGGMESHANRPHSSVSSLPIPYPVEPLYGSKLQITNDHIRKYVLKRACKFTNEEIVTKNFALKHYCKLSLENLKRQVLDSKGTTNWLFKFIYNFKEKLS